MSYLTTTGGRASYSRRRWARTRVLLRTSAVLAAFAAGCNSEDDASDGGKDASSEVDSSADAAQEGSPGDGDEGGASKEPLYTFAECSGSQRDEGVAEGFPSCDNICGEAHCLPLDLAGDGVPDSASCPDDGTGTPGKCVPDTLVELSSSQGPAFRFGACTSHFDGGDGVCVPLCYVPKQVHSLLRRDTCGTDELCVPCRNQDGSFNALCHFCDPPDVDLDAGVGDGGTDGDAGDGDAGDGDAGDGDAGDADAGEAGAEE